MSQGKITEKELAVPFKEKINNMNSQVNSNTTEISNIKDQVTNNRPIVINDDYPVGGFMWFTTNSIPEGWLLCNGQSITKTAYPDLFNAIGYQHGGSGENFNVPNLTNGARFVRSITGDWQAGRLEWDEFGRHNHFIAFNQQGEESVTYNPYTSMVTEYVPTHTTTWLTTSTTERGGDETRPKNIALTPCIKAKQRAKDMITVGQEWTNFKENGGEVGSNKTLPNITLPGYIKCRGIMTNENDETLWMNGNLTPWAATNNQTIGLAGYPFKDIYLSGESKNSNGYTKLPNGMIMQWLSLKDSMPEGFRGYRGIQGNFPIQFSTLLTIVASPHTNSSDFNKINNLTVAYDEITLGKASVRFNVGSDGAWNVDVKVWAIGY